ncbi:methyltransferase [Arthrobacter livingstonensis]|uniref:Methyltransferase n=1 Tax=Arthrobacter livingstonensis TaxID=670078 RepID=A0A2V5LB03_9MICC|nr:class I SAM-dependent methyltransferase [Arthrobacter livingstonensis]PYI68795.1 methyltransferase [Arthrobacter livingstonensis]
MTTNQASVPIITWVQDGGERSALWRSANNAPAPKNVVPADDFLTADDAYRLAAQGTALLWTGDYHNARQLLSAMARRIPAGKKHDGGNVADAFYRYRQSRSHRARMLGLLLVPLEPGPAVALRRAPDIAEAWLEAAGPVESLEVAPLQDVLGAIGAHEWRRNGVYVEALDAKISPHYGTFAPIRSEYLDLVAAADLPARDLAFDVGTGTGVLAAILARRGVKKVVATDSEPRAIACAVDNLRLLGLAGQVEPVLANMFPAGRAPLIVCNPPWLPGTPHTLLDNAVYDPKSRMLKAFLAGLDEHLEPGGEGWLVISDLAEHLGLRSRAELLGWIEQAGLTVKDRLDTPAKHPRSMDRNDPFFAARSREVTSLWRLTAR